MKLKEINDNSPLFSINTSYDSILNKNSISKDIRKIFRTNGIKLSDDISVIVEKAGIKWLIDDNITKQVYLAKLKFDKIVIYDNIHIGNQIVDAGLCVRCGACEPACPVDIIKFDNNALPYITNESLCITSCNRCLKVCPGEIVDYAQMDKEMFGQSPSPESITGLARRALVSYSNNEFIRKKGASGGFVTQLLVYLLENKIIDGALVLGSTHKNGYEIKPLVARTTEELIAAQKSKYVVVPFLQPLEEIENMEGNYAVVGIPCHIHSLRKYQKVSKKLRERIKLVIGLYCNVAFEPYLINDVLEFSGYKKEDVTEFEFRAGTWPGGVEITSKDGNIHKPLKFEDMKDTFNSLKLFYTAPRCNMCIDFSAEHADISVGDPWLRGRDGKYLFTDGRTTVLTRTKYGDKIVDMAAEAGYIDIREIPLKTWMVNFESHANYKRALVPKVIILRKIFRLPFPKYSKDVHPGKYLDYIPTLIKTIILYISGKSKFFRKIGLTLLQTKLAITFFRWNRKRKEKHFSDYYNKLEKFVEKVEPKAHIYNEKTSEFSEVN